MTHALGSIERFHSNLETTSQFQHELIIASQILRQDLTPEQLDYLYDSFTPKTETYKNNNLVHPILIIYEDSYIGDIEVACSGNLDGESRLSDRMRKRIPELIRNIQSKILNHSKVKTVFLEFFFLPTTSVKQLRHTMYQAIHGVAYIPQNPTAKTKEKSGRD
ncbi:Hachiman antiphage defense system protein HamA [Paenibacillus sp. S25]|uniref:Hachiman antiphage defense system protein HamA n=1 Tax=Paenibacillus sp. S25 TaxID=2823905 RepID=UPI001C645FD6